MLSFSIMQSSAILADEKNLTIPVIISSNSASHQKLLSGIKFTLPFKLKIIYLSDNSKELESELNSNNSNLPIITIGNLATSYVIKRTNKKVIFGNTNFSREKIGYEEGNTCGYFSEISTDRLFYTVKKIAPNIKRISTITISNSGNYYTMQGNYSDIFHRVLFKSIFLNTQEELQEVLQKLKGNTDAIFLNSDSISSQEDFEILSKYCRENKILLFSNISLLTDLGVGFSLEPDFLEMGKNIGSLTEKVVQGNEDCGLGPYFFPEKDILRINKEYMESSGFLVSKEIEEKTELESLNNKAIELYLNGKRNTAGNIFKYILSKDKKNKTAASYLQEIKNEKYEDKIKGLTIQADSAFQKNNFIQARNYYDEILKLNPNSPGINEKREMCTTEYSEQKRKQALQLEKSNRPYEAILIYKESIAIYPQNQTSLQELESLKNRLSQKIPEMHIEGQSYYNTRNYSGAISIYNNILLLNDNDKKAKEYLRLSIEKKEALEKLTNCKNDKVNPCPL